MIEHNDKIVKFVVLTFIVALFLMNIIDLLIMGNGNIMIIFVVMSIVYSHFLINVMYYVIVIL